MYAYLVGLVVHHLTGRYIDLDSKDDRYTATFHAIVPADVIRREVAKLDPSLAHIGIFSSEGVFQVTAEAR
jgi:hypothetical protein